jgi:nucleoside-diphosphate-sugar epimerase
MADILILGGTRNLGHFTALSLLQSGHNVTVLNRGVTDDSLPAEVERIRADRRDTSKMRAALDTLSFDMVFDTTTYTGAEARQAVELFGGNTDLYVFVSSGQVYLVRDGATRPFREEDYDGALIPEPPRESPDYDDWKYGVDKRDAEDVFSAAAESAGFPVLTLRLPMVASEMDHRGRIQCYIARVLDRGPLLLPEEDGLPLRHVYAKDVAALVTLLASREGRASGAYNISYGESMSLEGLVGKLAAIAGVEPHIVRVPRAQLEQESLLPWCSPFSGKWMSELDNSKSVAELGARYTPPEVYLRALVEDYVTRWERGGSVPPGLEKRQAEVLAAYPKT